MQIGDLCKMAIEGPCGYGKGRRVMVTSVLSEMINDYIVRRCYRSPDGEFYLDPDSSGICVRKGDIVKSEEE